MMKSSVSSSFWWSLLVMVVIVTTTKKTTGPDGRRHHRIGVADAAAGGKKAPTEATCPSGSKRLFVFVGPHRSASSSVEEFFMKYARGPRPDGIYDGLKSTRWPLVYGPHTNSTYPDKPYKRFNSLITVPNKKKNDKELRQEILDSLQRDWMLADDVDNIIFGGEEFDQMKPFAGNGINTDVSATYDSVDAVREVVDYLKIPSMGCVTIVINYRLSRFKHWISMYNNLNYVPSNTQTAEDTIDTDDDTTSSTSTIDGPIKSYEQYMCGETEVDKQMRIRELGTTMNPMYLSTQFLQEGYAVRMIDMSGIGKSKDISDTIACHVLTSSCDGKGWVSGHEGEPIRNAVINGKTQVEQQLIKDAELIFEYRDCAYQRELDDHPNFKVVYHKDTWKHCVSDDDSTMSQIYNSLRRGVVLKEENVGNKKGKTDTSILFDNSNGIGTVEEGNQLLFDALLSQVECSTTNDKEVAVTMKGVLTGQYIKDIITLASTNGGKENKKGSSSIKDGTKEDGDTKNKDASSLIDDDTTTSDDDGGGASFSFPSFSSIPFLSSFSVPEFPLWVWILTGSLVSIVLCCGCVCIYSFIDKCCRGCRRRRGGKYAGISRETEMTAQRERPGGRGRQQQQNRQSKYNRNSVEHSFKDESSDSDYSDDDDSTSTSSSHENVKLTKTSFSTSLSSLPPSSSSSSLNQSSVSSSQAETSVKKVGVIKGLFSRFGRKDTTKDRINTHLDDIIPNAHPPFYSDNDDGYSEDAYDEEEDVICFEDTTSGDII